MVLRLFLDYILLAEWKLRLCSLFTSVLLVSCLLHSSSFHSLENWCWSWSYNTLATWCEELTQWKRPWHWEILKAGGEGDDRGWDVWMVSLTRWTWVWVNSGSWWWTGRPDVLQSVGLQRVGHNWETGKFFPQTSFTCLALAHSSTVPSPNSASDTHTTEVGFLQIWAQIFCCSSL